MEGDIVVREGGDRTVEEVLSAFPETGSFKQRWIEKYRDLARNLGLEVELESGTLKWMLHRLPVREAVKGLLQSWIDKWRDEIVGGGEPTLDELIWAVESAELWEAAEGLKGMAAAIREERASRTPGPAPDSNVPSSSVATATSEDDPGSGPMVEGLTGILKIVGFLSEAWQFFKTFGENFADLARHLGVPVVEGGTRRLDKWVDFHGTGQVNRKLALGVLIETWLEAKGGRARIGELIAGLEAVGMNTGADKLRKEFIPGWKRPATEVVVKIEVDKEEPQSPVIEGTPTHGQGQDGDPRKEGERRRGTPCSSKALKDIGVQTSPVEVEVQAVEEELQRLREEHAEEVARIRREFEIELEAMRTARAAQPEPQAAVLMEVEPRPTGDPDEDAAVGAVEGELTPPSSSEALRDPEAVAVAASASPAEVDGAAAVPVSVVQDELERDGEPDVASSVMDTLEPAPKERLQKMPLRRSSVRTSTRRGDADNRKDSGGAKNRKTEVVNVNPATSPKLRRTPKIRTSLRRPPSNLNGTSSSKTLAASTSNPALKPTRSRASSKLATHRGIMRIKTGPTRFSSFRCCHCKKKLSSRRSLLRHVEDIHEQNVKGRYCCRFCKKRFSYKSYYNQHLRTHEDADLYKCPTPDCGKKLQNRQSFEHHLQTHNSNRPRDFQCPICNKGYFTAMDLAQHEKTHRDEKPFDCPQCPKVFKTNHELNLHLVAHSDHRPFSCEHCEWSFKRSSDLVVHLLIHGNERPHFCQHCSATFRRKHHLTNHIRRTHREGRVEKERPFECQICGQGFTRKYTRDKHQQDQHQTDVAPTSSASGARGVETTRRSRRLRVQSELDRAT